MKNKYKIVLSIAFIAMLGFIFYIYLFKYIKQIDYKTVVSSENVTKQENMLKEFIDKKLTDESGGIYTNYLDNKSDGDLTKGHNILSESQGMMLTYYLYKSDKVGFEKTFEYLKDNMLLENDLISWRIEDKSPSKVSATIDDIRIVKALLLASDEFKSIKYRYYALKIADAVYENLINDYSIIDFNDGYKNSTVTTLCYLNLDTIKILSSLDDKWKQVYDKSINIINKGYIGNNLPLYKKNYDNSTNKYDNEENIDSLLSVLVILNKAEAKEDVKESVEWIKGRLNKFGYISTSYNVSNMNESKIESTSIYANIAQIAKVIGDKSLYDIAINKMINFQIKNKNSEIYGSFGDESTKQVYSYDNLNALLAFRRSFNIK